MSELLGPLWELPLEDPVQPRLLDAMTGLDEKLLSMYRGAPTRWLGRRVGPDVIAALRGKKPYAAVHQVVRMAGIALWEREHERIAESIGV
jgi:hypothetical protein